MSGRHTPGPWTLKEGTGEIIASDGEVVADADLFTGRHKDEEMANARLIAAAPDLLQAVEHATGFISAMCELAGIEDDIALNARRKDIGESYKLRLSDIIQHATDTLSKVYGESARAATGKGVQGE